MLFKLIVLLSPNSSPLLQKEQLIFLVALLILIIAGNSLVLLTLACNKRRKPRMNYFIKHLAYSGKLSSLGSNLVQFSGSEQPI